MKRKTYAYIDGDVLRNNVKNICQNYPDYKYYFGVVKNSAYHHGMECIKDLIEGGVNYLAVSSLEEALKAREFDSFIPILCLEPISLDVVHEAILHHISLTVDKIDYLKELEKLHSEEKMIIHLKIDSGMCRLGFQNKKDFYQAFQIVQKNDKMNLEGIYSHFATSGVEDPYWQMQVEKFLEITEDVDLAKVPIVHFGRSLTLVNHPKLPFCNGIRLGIVMYGFSQTCQKRKGLKGFFLDWKLWMHQKKYHCQNITRQNQLELGMPFSLYSEVISVREVLPNTKVGYDITKVLKKGYILTIPIGYGDGVTKCFQNVYIDQQRYPILSDCMDMIMVFSEKEFAVGTKVEIFGPHLSIREVCRNTKKNAYHVLSDISSRVIRVYKSHGEEKEYWL